MTKPNLEEHQEVVAAKDMLMRAGFKDIMVMAASPTVEGCVYMAATGDPDFMGQVIENSEMKITGEVPKKGFDKY